MTLSFWMLYLHFFTYLTWAVDTCLWMLFRLVHDNNNDAAVAAFRLLFKWPIFQRLLGVSPCLPKKNLANVRFFASQMPFLSPNQHCHSSNSDRTDRKGIHPVKNAALQAWEVPLSLEQASPRVFETKMVAILEYATADTDILLYVLCWSCVSLWTWVVFTWR